MSDTQNKLFLGGVMLFCGLFLLTSMSMAIGITFGVPCELSMVAFVMTIVLIAAIKDIKSIPEDEE
jgi:hypothetical protein